MLISCLVYNNDLQSSGWVISCPYSFLSSFTSSLTSPNLTNSMFRWLLCCTCLRSCTSAEQKLHNTTKFHFLFQVKLTIMSSHGEHGRCGAAQCPQSKKEPEKKGLRCGNWDGFWRLMQMPSSIQKPRACLTPKWKAHNCPLSCVRIGAETQRDRDHSFKTCNETHRIVYDGSQWQIKAFRWLIAAP